MQRVYIINSRGRKHPYVQSLVDQSLRLSQASDHFQYTKGPEHAVDLAQEATELGADEIIAVGGDGTLHEVVNGIMQAQKGSVRINSPKVGLLPLGSGNDVARFYGLSLTPAGLRRRSPQVQVVTIDLLEISYRSTEGSARTRYCVNVADVGLGGLVAKLVTQRSRALNADLRYALSVAEGMLRYRKQVVRVSYDNDHWEGKAMSICMANFPYFGSGMGIAPHAHPNDSKAAITVIGDVSLWDYLRQLPDLRACRFLKLEQIVYKEAQTCAIDSEYSIPLEIDGECVGSTPLSMKVIPSAIQLIV